MVTTGLFAPLANLCRKFISPKGGFVLKNALIVIALSTSALGLAQRLGDLTERPLPPLTEAVAQWVDCCVLGPTCPRVTPAECQPPAPALRDAALDFDNIAAASEIAARGRNQIIVSKNRAERLVWILTRPQVETALVAVPISVSEVAGPDGTPNGLCEVQVQRHIKGEAPPTVQFMTAGGQFGRRWTWVSEVPRCNIGVPALYFLGHLSEAGGPPALWAIGPEEANLTTDLDNVADRLMAALAQAGGAQ